jgi:hypothetical protein
MVRFDVSGPFCRVINFDQNWIRGQGQDGRIIGSDPH